MPKWEDFVTKHNGRISVVNPDRRKLLRLRSLRRVYQRAIFYGEFVDGGFIYNDTDTSLLDILYQDEPMTMGGM